MATCGWDDWRKMYGDVHASDFCRYIEKCRFKRDFTWGIESGSPGGYQQSGLEPVGDQHSGYFEYHRRDPKRSADSGDWKCSIAGVFEKPAARKQ